MPSTYTLNNGIELIGTGEQSGTWGDTTNTNLSLLDIALDGQVTITASSAGSSGSPNILPIAEGTDTNSEGRNRLVIITSGTDLGSDVYYKLTPSDAEKIIYIRNDLNAQDLIVFQGTYNASNDYVIPNGKTAVIFFDGAGSGAVAANVFNNAHFDAMNIVGNVDIGGTLAVTSTSTFSDDVTLTGASYNVVWDKSDNALEFADDAKAVFGAGSDLQIYHDGDNSYIDETGTGTLRIRGYNQVRIADTSDNIAAIFKGDAETTLYHNDSPKLATESGGVNVTGTLTSDALTVDGTATVNANIFEISSTTPSIRFTETDTTDENTQLLHAGGNFRIRTASDDYSTTTDRMLIDHSTGDTEFFGDVTVSSTAAASRLMVRADNDGAGDGPIVDIYRNSASPAVADDIGQLYFSGQNSADAKIQYVDIHTFIQDPTDGSEDGRVQFRYLSGGSFINALDMRGDTGGAQGSVVVNQGGQDVDFIVEGDSDNSLLNVDASTNRVGISIATPLEQLHVEEAIRIEAVTPRLRFYETDGSDDENFQIQVAGGNLQFLKNNDNFASGAVRFDMDQSGNVAISSNGTEASTDARLLLRQIHGQVGLKVTNDDGDSAIDPIVEIYRDSSTPADNDFIGRLNFSGNNDADQALAYVRFQSRILDVTDGNEDGQMQLQTRYSGAMSNFITYFGGDQGKVKINEDQLNIDFQVETAGDSHALFVEGSSNSVGIGNSAPEDKLHVEGRIRLESTAPSIRFKETDTTDENWDIVATGGTFAIREQTDNFDSATTRFRISQGGDINMGTSLSIDYGAVLQVATANNNTQLAVVSTDNDANVGPDLKLLRASATPADGDRTGRIRFVAYDDGGNEITVARIETQFTDVTDTSEDGLFEIDTVISGASRSRLKFNSTTAIFNEDGQDIDFRVESENKNDAFFIQGNTGRVGLGVSAPTAPLHVLDDTVGAMVMIENNLQSSPDDHAPELTLYRNLDTPADGDAGGAIEFNFNDSAGNNTTFVRMRSVANDVTNNTEDGALYFDIRTNGTIVEQMRIDQGGVGIGGVTAETGIDLQVQGTAKFSKTNNDFGLILECTDSDINDGPNLLMDRDSPNPANNDNLGRIVYRGRNSADEEIDYVTVRAEARTVDDGNEDGRYQISVRMDGSGVNVFDIDLDGSSNEVVINEGGLDIDFRVEGSGQQNLLVTRASNDCVIMGNNSTITSNPKLAVHQGSSGLSGEMYRASSTGTATILNLYSDNGGTQNLVHHFEANGDLEIDGTLTQGSDRRIKQDIVDSGSQWDDIKAVQVRKYRKIWDVEQYGDDADVLLGVVAQELEASGMGGLVKTRVNEEDPDDDLKSVKYSVLYMKAIKALQEAMERIETLEAKVTALENS